MPLDDGRAARAAAAGRRARWRRCSATSATSAPPTRSARPTATSSAASAASSPNPPDLVAYPETRREVEAVLAWCADEGAAVDAVRRRHQRRRRRRAAQRGDTGRRSPSTCAGSTGSSRSTRSRAPPGSRPGRRGPRWRTSCASTASRCATSRSRSSTRPSAAGSRPGPAATSRPLYTHIDDLVESVRAVTPRGRVGEPPAARLGRRARRPTGCCSAPRGSSG